MFQLKTVLNFTITKIQAEISTVVNFKRERQRIRGKSTITAEYRPECFSKN
jgi:hypothetical protein